MATTKVCVSGLLTHTSLDRISHAYLTYSSFAPRVLHARSNIHVESPLRTRRFLLGSPQHRERQSCACLFSFVFDHAVFVVALAESHRSDPCWHLVVLGLGRCSACAVLCDIFSVILCEPQCTRQRAARSLWTSQRAPTPP